MNRRTFLVRSTSLVAGGVAAASLPAWVQKAIANDTMAFDAEFYRRFKNPLNTDRPFVRWFWNGNKLESGEIVRELRLLHGAGIGGVEINPTKFPEEADDAGKHIRSLVWLSDEWVDMLGVTFAEAKRLGMACDLIVGSGFPFGGEFLEGEELGQIMVPAIKRITGPQCFTCTPEELFKEADPAVNNPYEGRTFELCDLKLVPEYFENMDQVVDLSDRIGEKRIILNLPAEGTYVLYALVKITAFMKIINGAEGAEGPVMNHYNREALLHYLNRMGDAIEARTGPISENIRALFIDGVELEGANWCADLPREFRQRRGYDMMPWLPFTMYKRGGMGVITDFGYGARPGPELRPKIERVRYDFYLTLGELLNERFLATFDEWCHDHGVLSRVQPYGMGFFPMASVRYADIPEGESWSSNWLRHRPGEEMPDNDWRRGRSYTMINKYVASGAHLSGKRIVSAEETTNTYDVFNATLDFMKLASDQSVISGITHSVWHGFNYSPPEAGFPGWIRYGGFYSPMNNWWPYFRCLNDYKGRLSAALHQSDMYTDIGILTPLADMWSEIGMQMEPFPALEYVPWQTLVWEAMNKHGHASDYLSDEIIRNAVVRDGRLCFGPKAYPVVFLVGVECIHPAGLERLLELVEQGGRVFTIEAEPSRSPGLHDSTERDAQVKRLLQKLHGYPDRYIHLKKPADDNFMDWWSDIQARYNVTPYLHIANPNRFVMQHRYWGDGRRELIFIANTHRYDDYRTVLRFPAELTAGKYPWIWDPSTGERYRFDLDADGGMEIELGPAESRLIVFDSGKEGPRWKPLPASAPAMLELGGWDVELRHSLEGWEKTLRMETLQDLKDTEYINFTGTVIYRTTIRQRPDSEILNLGRVAGVSEAILNGKNLGVTWHGRRLYDLRGKLRRGDNLLEVKVVTTMGNYVRTLTGNPTATKWTSGRKTQADQSMGLIGPVTIYKTDEKQ